MATPIDFLNALTARLTDVQIPFAVTSGMACVFYGIQQTTKDVDVILPEPSMSGFLDLLEGLEHEMPPWRVSYRPVCGAPLDRGFMVHGWTSHLALWDGPASPEHHLDVFSRPPRIRKIERASEDDRFVSRHVAAMMKRTDRDRDWPIVDALGLQLRRSEPALALLHVQDAELLLALWSGADADARASAMARRPLLRLLPTIHDPDALDAWIRLERLIWETVNKERYRPYQAAWKEFYRRWRADDAFEWPTVEPIREQHERLVEAARRFELVPDPLGVEGRERLYERALERVLVRGNSDMARVTRVRPPIEEILP